MSNLLENAKSDTETEMMMGSGGSGGGGGGNGAKTFSRTPTSWDAEDDILLMHLKDQQKLGWKEIASHFNNRTPNACQFRWRRLKSGNLKNPPKSAAALGTLIPKNSDSGSSTGNNPSKHQKPKKLPLKKESPGFAGTYSPISNVSFTGYDNSISNALAGLNALSNSSSITSPMSSFQGNSGIKNNDNSNPSTPSINSPSLVQTTNLKNASNLDDSIPLDPQHHQNAAANTGGGYYVDISIDPTSNLPHNLPHPQTPSSITPRNSTYGTTTGTQTLPNFHNNSIIQIIRDDRTSISSGRDSVSSLPSKSMNIPHHQLNTNSLAHLPILFGNNSVSGPSRNSSISGAAGIQHSNTVTSLRNGSIVGSSLGYYSRSGSVVIPYNADRKDPDLSSEATSEGKKQETTTKTTTPKIKANSYNFSHRKHKDDKDKHKDKDKDKDKEKPSTPVFKLPWTMEEDELLINRRNRELSFAELSILLPQRTEGEIWSRIDYLEKLKNGHRSLNSRDRRRRLSSVGLDDVDDFYDDVIGGIGVSDDDDDVDDEEHDVLVDVDDALGSHRRRRKRRTSSAVNPLAVSDSIRRRLR